MEAFVLSYGLHTDGFWHVHCLINFEDAPKTGHVISINKPIIVHHTKLSGSYDTIEIPDDVAITSITHQ